MSIVLTKKFLSSTHFQALGVKAIDFSRCRGRYLASPASSAELFPTLKAFFFLRIDCNCGIGVMFLLTRCTAAKPRIAMLSRVTGSVERR